jgi:F-type H+-transporting ATPase subunit delta
VAIDIANGAGLSPLVRDFVGLVARQGRAPHLEAIASAYRQLVDEAQGRVRARVRTAVALTDSERQALRERLARALERRGAGTARRGQRIDVVVEEVVDPQLLGGFVAEVGTYIVDGSLDGQLAQLRDRLARA